MTTSTSIKVKASFCRAAGRRNNPEPQLVLQFFTVSPRIAYESVI
jgi:hypothetical protein